MQRDGSDGGGLSVTSPPAIARLSAGARRAQHGKYVGQSPCQKRGMAGVAVGLSCSVTSGLPDNVLRPARPGDAAALAAIDALVNPSPWTAGQFASACNAGGLERTLVLEQVQQVVGFVVYSCVLDEACIHNLAVHPADQRKGLGRILLLAVLEESRGRGAIRCCLEVRASNRAARGLYQAFGFREDGLRKNYYGGAGHPGAGHPGAGPSAREDAVLLSVKL